MRVAMYYNNSDVRVEELPTPKIGPGELLVKIEASGICGSDVMEWYRIHKAPLVLGHEIAGTIVEVGDGVTQYKIGDRIAAAHHVPCDQCHYCLTDNETACNTLRSTSFDPGGFAEYLRMPAINVKRGVFLIPDNVSFDEATFVEPLACVLRGQRKATFKEGQSVLVLGCGMAGLLHVHLAHAMGASKVIATDIVDYRLDAAKRLGASDVINANDFAPERLRELNDGRLADLVIVCTGVPAVFQQSLKLVERGGTILIFALTRDDVSLSIPINEFFSRNEVTLTTSYAGSPDDYQQALDLIATHRVDVKNIITHRLSMEEARQGFALVAKAEDCLKVIIEPQR
ncbi:MAG: alcohol dehydrogenase catalytic domain-containing protein [Chloroflexi bacterium]|jgi:L-iditol 2-dehydrogenase|nr:alcohol dehydrogenase catalytic domain-containing protein [Chloroflexota bacterium]MBT7080075.1 alcohol dehydrogenase catalytic domain-containing protein [Chloroflexota bacterium]MBT7290444.1 alcohol dehydrogenase catalytic domain-containing protein [Chloroflexota bacterium]